MLTRALVAALVLVSVTALPGTTRAQDWADPGAPTTEEPQTATEEAPEVDVARYPTTFTLRPITLPAMHLRADFGVNVLRLDFGAGFEDTVVSLGAGAAFGVLDDLEVGLGASPIAPVLPPVYGLGSLRGFGGVVRPESARGFVAPQLYGRYRFLSLDVFEMGAELGLIIPTEDADFGLSLGLPFRVRAGESFALDGSLGFLTVFGEDAAGDRDPGFLLTLNVAPRFAMELFYVGLHTGFFMDLENPDLTFIPLIFEAGVTLGVQATVLDFYVSGGLPYFLIPGSDGDKVGNEIWQIEFGARAHFDLGG